MDEGKDLIEFKEANILKRFFRFFKNIFVPKRNGLEEMDVSSQGPIKDPVIENNPVKPLKNNSFLQGLKIFTESPELVALQNKLEENEITLNDLSDEQVVQMSLLYKQQIQKLHNELQDGRVELFSLQSKINMYSQKLSN